MRTVKATTYRARTHRRLRGGAKKPAIKSVKALATKKSKMPELTPGRNEFLRLAKAHKEHEFFETMTDAELDTFAKALKSAKTKLATKKSTRVKEFLRLAKAHKEREFFETLTHAELDTFAKALKMKLSDSREKKLTRIIAYSKKYKPVLICVNTSVLAMNVLGVLSPTLLYILILALAMGGMPELIPFLKNSKPYHPSTKTVNNLNRKSNVDEGCEEDVDRGVGEAELQEDGGDDDVVMVPMMPEVEQSEEQEMLHVMTERSRYGHERSALPHQRQCAPYQRRCAAYQRRHIYADDGESTHKPVPSMQELVSTLMPMIGAFLATVGTLFSVESLSEMLKEFKRFQKALSDLK